MTLLKRSHKSPATTAQFSLHMDNTYTISWSRHQSKFEQQQQLESAMVIRMPLDLKFIIK